MLKIERFFNTFREHVAVYDMSASEFVTNRFDSHEAVFAITGFKIYIIELTEWVSTTGCHNG